MLKLYLDPGHGRSDPGAVSNRLQEKNLTLDIALRIRDLLLNYYSDVSLRMSRTTDIYKSLAQRTDDANEWGADYYLSIHINSANITFATGYEDYIHDSLADTSTTAIYQRILHEEITKLNNLYDRGMKKVEVP